MWVICGQATRNTVATCVPYDVGWRGVKGLKETCHIGGEIMECDPCEWSRAPSNTPRIHSNSAEARSSQGFHEACKVLRPARPGWEEHNRLTRTTHLHAEGCHTHPDPFVG